MRFALAAVFALIVRIAVAQAQSNAEELYRQTRDRVIEQIYRLPRYTCVQTITRRTYRNPSLKNSAGCDRVLPTDQSRKLALVEWDRLRVDVAIADQKEVYSWVGAARFEESDLSKLVGGGQTTMGDFGSLVLSIFHDHPVMHFEGERTINGRRLLEFSFETPENLSHYQVRISFMKFMTGYSGSVLLDANTGDLVRVTALSAVLPPQTGYCRVSKQLDYTRLRIGSADALIPSEATSTAIDRDEVEMSSSSAYSSCREYVGESVLRFDDPGAAEAGSSIAAAGATGAPVTIPPGLPFECRVLSTIDSDTAASGDPIEGVLRTPIADASGKVLASAGTRVHGRLMRFTQHPPSGNRKESFEIELQLRSLDIGGERVPFAANISNVTSPSRGSAIHLSLHPFAGTFFYYDKKLHLTNIDAKWITATPSDEQKSAP
jgi:hypothetical protein